MREYKTQVKSVDHVTHDVLKIVTEKPPQYSFNPGQATEVAIDKDGWRNEKRPFTFTSLPNDEYLEFIVKTYPSHEGVTNELLKLKKDDKLILHEVFGAIVYEGEGTFIAGGAGVTPFISIFRHLRSQNKIGNNTLIFANKTKADIIHQQEFEDMLGKNFINILADEKTDEHAHGFITEEFLKNNKSNSNKYIYLCGPPPMMEAVEKQLSNLKIDKNSIIKEDF